MRERKRSLRRWAGKKNDRLIAVSANAELHRDVKSLSDLEKKKTGRTDRAFLRVLQRCERKEIYADRTLWAKEGGAACPRTEIIE
jgi:hypothetical protein